MRYEDLLSQPFDEMSKLWKFLSVKVIDPTLDFAEIDKLQALQLRQSLLDRWSGMASLWLDTAGAGAMAPPLRIRYLPLAQAQALLERLQTEIARRPLRW